VVTAKSKPMLDSLGAKLVNMLPDDADATILERLRGGSGEPVRMTAPATSG
jgi:membrane protein required for colicin V production